MYKFIYTIMLCCVMVYYPQAKAQLAEKEKPKIGLVLSGGGARGAAHVGVLKVLEENHIPIDMIAGTSFGAIIGGLYASGYSADELEEIIKNIDWQETLSNSAPRKQKSFRRKKDDDGFLIKFKVGLKDGKIKLPSGLITPNNLRLLFAELLNKKTQTDDFSKLSIPFRAVATNLENGEEVILKNGNLASAIVASMTVPALFPPVELNGTLLVDGGIANNIPINVARDMGADIIIVVDVTTPLLKKEEITSFASVLDQLTSLQSHKTSDKLIATLKDEDILIRPELDNIDFLDFDITTETIPKGVEAALSVLDHLKKYSLNQNNWNNYTKNHSEEKYDPPTIDFVRINNNSDVSDQVIRSHITQKEGQLFDAAQLSKDLTEIYGLELFEEVNYQTLNENGETGLEIRTRQREGGEDYFRFGLAIQEDFEGESDFQLAVGFTNLAINSYGGEWQTLFKVGQEFSLFTELYQPIDYKEKYYLFANAGGGKINRNLLSDNGDGTILGQVRISEFGTQIGAGRNFGRWGTLRTGIRKTFGNIKGRISSPPIPKISYDKTKFVTEFHIDTLDNTQFPSSGAVMEIVSENTLSWLGGDSGADTVEIGGYFPFSWGKNTIGLRPMFATSYNGNPNETNLFPLGGFMRLTAFAPGQLTGNHGGLLTAIYYRRISGGPQYLTETPIYLGGTVEAGNVWNRWEDVSLTDLRWSSSVFVGIDTILGPTYLGIGVGSEGATAAFLNIGQIF
ncbi:MAG: patatin-like phospholipase family protein [Kordiimonadaceae bacterium]|nr:patatin-like phospholipase family protein [Kordiimonadaceae bacterium]